MSRNLTLLRIGIEREGGRVLLAVRDENGSQAVNLECGARGGAALATNLGAAACGDEDFASEFSIRGELTLAAGGTDHE